MTFKDKITSDLSTFFNTDEFAETITYTAVDGIDTDIIAVVERDNRFQEPYVRGEETATYEITVKKSDVPDPQHGDIFSIPTKRWDYDEDIVTESETWELDPVRGVIGQDENTVTIALIRRD